MKTVAAAATLALLATTAVQAGAIGGGMIDYTWNIGTTTATAGDTVVLTLHAEIDPEQTPYWALSYSSFDITVDDLTGGTIGNPALANAFAGFGSYLGDIGPTGITDVTAGQLPEFLNPLIEKGTSLDLYSFEYTVTDATPRFVEFDLSSVTNEVYTGPGAETLTYGSSVTPGRLEITGVPAPGAMALLTVAGLVGRGRRRRQLA